MSAIHRLPGFVALAVIVFSSTSAGQSPPPRPRILLTSAKIPQILTDSATPGTRQADALAAMVTSASWSSPSQSAWVTMRSLRRMLELSVRYALTGNAAQGANAKSLLLSAVSSFSPTSASPYQNGTYPASIAAAYDLIHPLLSTSERTQVVNHLESWVNVLTPSSSVAGSYLSYTGCTDNYSWGWAGGLCVVLLSIWGESSISNIPSRVSDLLARMNLGWKDAVSPDGSVDEAYGYMNYGTLWSLWAAIAGQHCGFGDALLGTNVLKTPRWLASSVFREDARWSVPWFGDSSPISHGIKWDPILYHLVARQQDQEGLWVLDEIFRSPRGEPIGDNSTTWCWSPHVNMLLLAPSPLLQATPPAIRSALYRDNLNQAPSELNKTVNYTQVGAGGLAFLRNTNDPWSETQLAVHYMIRDEWMNHAHEDDGHVGIAFNGRRHFVDQGYNGNGGAQDYSHNIVTVAGAASFLGGSNNYYSPPAPEGRFLGTVKGRSFTPALDYVRGDHSNVWGMEKAERSVCLLKDPTAPIALVIDELRKGGLSSHTYEQRWHSSGPMGGAGTLTNPYTTNGGGGQILNLTFIDSPPSTLALGGAVTTGHTISYRQNKILFTQPGSVSLIGVHHGTPLNNALPLVGASGNARGGTLVTGARQDKVMVKTDQSAMSDSQTQSDAEFVWLRRVNGVLSAFAAMEGTYLSDSGGTLFTASTPLQMTYAAGRVDLVTLPNASALGTLPYVVVNAAGISDVRLDGVSVPFAATSTGIAVGSAPAPTVPNTDDRFYTFTGGDTLDGALGSDTFVLPSGELVALGPNAWFAPRNDAALPSEPLYTAVSFTPTADAFGRVGFIEIGSGSGMADLATVEMQYISGFGGSAILTSQQSSDVVLLPLGNLAPLESYRIGLEYDPAGGQLTLIDREGRAFGSVGVPPRTGTFHVRLSLMSGALFDDVALFDSREDGVTPQGVFVWKTADGNVGFAAHHPTVGLGGGFTMSVLGVALSQSLFTSVLSAFQFQQLIVNASAPTGTTFSPYRREVALESAVSLGASPGSIPVIVDFTTITGVTLQAGILF